MIIYALLEELRGTLGIRVLIQGTFERTLPFSVAGPDSAPRGLRRRGGGVLLIAKMAQGSPPAGGNQGYQMVRSAILLQKQQVS